MSSVEGPVSLANAGPVALGLLSVGFTLAGSFVVAESSKQRSIPYSLLLAILSSGALGFGFVILFLWMGIFV